MSDQTLPQKAPTLEELSEENRRLRAQLHQFAQTVHEVEAAAEQSARNLSFVEITNEFALTALSLTEPEAVFSAAAQNMGRAFEAAMVLGVMMPTPAEPRAKVQVFLGSAKARTVMASPLASDAVRALALRSRPALVQGRGLVEHLSALIPEMIPGAAAEKRRPSVVVPVRNHVPARRGFFVLFGSPCETDACWDKETKRMTAALPFLELMQSLLERSLHAIGLSAELSERSEALVEKNAELSASLAELNRSKQRLVQTSKMEAIGRLAAGVAHDFNNILTIIGTSAALAFDEVGGEHPVAEDLKEISNASERAARLTSQLLEFSRQSKGRISRIDVNSQVRDILPMLERMLPAGVTLHTHVDVHTPPAAFDLGHFEQVLLNLVANAVDALSGPGNIKLTVRPIARRNVLGTMTDWVELRVADDGPGMDAKTQEKIFEPFFTTKEVGRGTGLGLATVYGVIKQAGGNIEVKSSLGHGTTFIILLPVHVSAQDEETAPTMSNISRRSKNAPCVMVVEDEPQIRRLAARVLKRDGFTVLEAANGEEALEVMRGGEEPVQLLITDVVMPGGGGRMLADAALSRYPNISVLFMSGYAGDRLRAEGFETLPSAGEFLAKPFTPDALSRAVRYAFRQKPAPPRH